MRPRAPSCGCAAPARAQVAALQPGDGVLVLGTSRQPQACVKRDERALRTFFQCLVELPLPDHASRRRLLQHFAQACAGGRLGAGARLLN